MGSYYLAPSLAVLRSEINARWPARDKASVGWIGDAAHRGTVSDHNPNSRSSVNALDVDRDGVSVPEIIAAFQRHPAAQYWIFDRQIASRSYGWQRRSYTGSNPHDRHVHLSIRQARDAEQDTRPWGVAPQPEPEPPRRQAMIMVRAKTSKTVYITDGLRRRVVPNVAARNVFTAAGVPYIEVDDLSAVADLTGEYDLPVTSASIAAGLAPELSAAVLAALADADVVVADGAVESALRRVFGSLGTAA